jgi:hypothetical protein
MSTPIDVTPSFHIVPLTISLLAYHEQVRYDTHKTRLADPIVRIQPLVAPTRLITITDVGDVTMYDCKMT